MVEEDPLTMDLLQFIDYLQNQDLSEEQLEALFMQMETDAAGCEFWGGKEYQQLFRTKAAQLHQEAESMIEEENTCVEN